MSDPAAAAAAGDPQPRPAGQDQMPGECRPGPLRRCWRALGPGLTSGASNNDPSAIATYSQAGAATGFALLWAVPLLLPMMAGVVYLCAKLGMVSGRGLAGIIRERYPRWVLYPLVFALFIANTINAGADIGAVAASIELLVPVPRLWLVVPLTLIVLALVTWANYPLIANSFKWLTFALFAFVAAGLLAQPDPWAVLAGTFRPSLRWDRTVLSLLVAMVGTALSPYLYFWQSSQRVEEEVHLGRRRIWQRRGAKRGDLRYAAMDVNTGMVFAAVIIYFIILATAATLHQAGRHQVASAADAASALAPLAGRAASALFAAGFIGSGLLAIPVLTTGAAYAMAEAFNWPHGLSRRPSLTPQFYATLSASMLLGMLVNFLPINPMRLLLLAAILNGLLAPVTLLLVMLASNNRALMGRHTNRPLLNVLGWLTTAATAAAAVAFVVSWLA